jgi:phosphinothricin acetyltransferase
VTVPLAVRPATEADVDAVAAIYAREVAEGYATFDTTAPARELWVGKTTATDPRSPFLVAVEDERVLGFAYAGPYRERGAYANTRETTVYLSPEAAGRGIGRRLYDELLVRLVDAGVHTVLAAIALPNDASEGLHRACGYERLGIMRDVGRKFDRWIDVAWWQRVLGD